MDGEWGYMLTVPILCGWVQLVWWVGLVGAWWTRDRLKHNGTRRSPIPTNPPWLTLWHTPEHREDDDGGSGGRPDEYRMMLIKTELIIQVYPGQWDKKEIYN